MERGRQVCVSEGKSMLSSAKEVVAAGQLQCTSSLSGM